MRVPTINSLLAVLGGAASIAVTALLILLAMLVVRLAVGL